MFIEFEDDLIPLGQIKVCRANADNSTTNTTLDGKVFTSFSFYTVEAISKMAAPFVPAQPGYFKLCIPSLEDVIDDEWPSVPIVAWRMVGEFDFAEPITLQLPDSTRYAILTPDGSILCPSGSRYGSRTEFLNHLREEQAQTRSRRSAMPIDQAPLINSKACADLIGV
jgi:hypothetical protein